MKDGKRKGKKERKDNTEKNEWIRPGKTESIRTGEKEKEMA